MKWFDMWDRNAKTFNINSINEIKNVLKIASLYITTIIGAGFASGQEILQFFSSYYKGGFYGIVLSGLLFSILGAMLLQKIYCKSIKSYDQLLEPIFGRLWSGVLQIIITIFMISIFVIMTAGSTQILSRATGLSHSLCAIVMCLLFYLVIFFGIEGIVVLSTFITPLMLIGVFISGIYIIIFKDTAVFNVMDAVRQGTHNWLFSSILYVSYNSLTAIVLMSNLLPYINSKKTAKYGGFLGGILILLIAFIVNSAIFLFYPDITGTELPLIYILKKYSSTAALLYTVVLFLSMVISAVTSYYCAANVLSMKLKISKHILALAIAIAAVMLSKTGFSELISYVYPVFGYIGMLMLIKLLWECKA